MAALIDNLSQKQFEALLTQLSNADKSERICGSSDCVFDVAIDSPLIKQAACSPDSEAIFRCLRPIGENVRTEYWVDFVREQKNGFEVLKWFYKHGKIGNSGQVMIRLFDKNLMKTEFDYFVYKFPIWRKTEDIILHGEIAKSRKIADDDFPETSSDKDEVIAVQTHSNVCLNDLPETSSLSDEVIAVQTHSNMHLDQTPGFDFNYQVDVEITKAMISAVKHSHFHILEGLAKTKRGDPNAVIAALSGLKSPAANDYICVIIEHPRFDIKSNLGLFNIAAANNWDTVISNLTAKLTK